MKQPQTPKTPTQYKIKVKGILEKDWSDWFEGMAISYESDATILEGPLADQSALHGLMARIRDLNLSLVYLIQQEPDREDKKGHKAIKD